MLQGHRNEMLWMHGAGVAGARASWPRAAKRTGRAPSGWNRRHRPAAGPASSRRRRGTCPCGTLRTGTGPESPAERKSGPPSRPRFRKQSRTPSLRTVRWNRARGRRKGVHYCVVRWRKPLWKSVSRWLCARRSKSSVTRVMDPWRSCAVLNSPSPQ